MVGDAPFAHEKASMMRSYFTRVDPHSYTGQNQDYLKKVFSPPGNDTRISPRSSGISYDLGIGMKKMYESSQSYGNRAGSVAGYAAGRGYNPKSIGYQLGRANYNHTI